MQLNSFLLSLIIIFIPGIIFNYFFEALRPKYFEKRAWFDFLNIIFYSIISYAVYLFLMILVNGVFGLIYLLKIGNYVIKSSIIEIFNKIFSGKLISFTDYFIIELIIVSIISVFLSFFAVYIDTKNIIRNIGKHFNFTDWSGYDDVWVTYINKNCQNTYSLIRDKKFNIVYYAKILHYSDKPDNMHELGLEDVRVYITDNESRKLKEIFRIQSKYLCRNSEDIEIEIPNNIEKKGEENGKEGHKGRANIAHRYRAKSSSNRWKRNRKKFWHTIN